MTAEIVQIRDYQSKRNLARAEKELERQSRVASFEQLVATGKIRGDTGSGIDGMQFNYTAPDKDPA